MTKNHTVNWPLVLGLGVFALIRPLARIVQSQLDVQSAPAVPVALTLVISAVWIAVVGLSRNPQPVLTLVLAGLTYGVLSIVLSGLLSPILDGRLDGPLANPVAIVPVLMINAFWGLIAGALALLWQRARGARPPASSDDNRPHPAGGARRHP